jgi:N-methylhydantoinase A/oxoprolinase/acetone carboxylase beta subunit
MKYRLGVDVGGTNTDAVIVDPSDHVVAKVKHPVSADVMGSIRRAVQDVLNASRVEGRDVTHAMLGTTQVTNAIIERRDLNRVGVIRIGAPATLAIPPFTGWPEDLRRVVNGGTVVVGGGHEFDGRSLMPLDRGAVRRFLEERAGQLSAVAVTSVFSPVNAEHERWVKELVETEYPHLALCMSHEIGSVGLLERENATILNAAVITVARRTAEAFRDALGGAGVTPELYFAQNDGTLMAIDYALRFPILTVACGPTNSMRGAAFLSRLKDAVVVDVGGTSTDIGVIRGGFPRETTMAADIGGVRTNFRMPDLIALGLGGGSRVRTRPDGRVTVGPDSLGYRLVEDGQVFGGRELTFTDVAVRLGMARIGTREPTVDLDTARRVYAEAVRLLEDGIDRIKAAAEPMPLVAVGGGSALLPDQLAGVSTVIRPPHFDVANAIGAAIAQVSGRVDRIFAMAGRSREAVLEDARRMAEAEAVRAGADPLKVEVVEVEEVPLAYLPGNASRIRVMVAGPLHASTAGSVR